MFLLFDAVYLSKGTDSVVQLLLANDLHALRHYYHEIESEKAVVCLPGKDLVLESAR